MYEEAQFITLLHALSDKISFEVYAAFSLASEISHEAVRKVRVDE